MDQTDRDGEREDQQVPSDLLGQEAAAALGSELEEQGSATAAPVASVADDSETPSVSSGGLAEREQDGMLEHSSEPEQSSETGTSAADSDAPEESTHDVATPPGAGDGAGASEAVVVVDLQSADPKGDGAAGEAIGDDSLDGSDLGVPESGAAPAEGADSTDEGKDPGADADATTTAGGAVAGTPASGSLGAFERAAEAADRTTDPSPPAEPAVEGGTELAEPKAAPEFAAPETEIAAMAAPVTADAGTEPEEVVLPRGDRTLTQEPSSDPDAHDSTPGQPDVSSSETADPGSHDQRSSPLPGDPGRSDAAPEAKSVSALGLPPEIGNPEAETEPVADAAGAALAVGGPMAEATDAAGHETSQSASGHTPAGPDSSSTPGVQPEWMTDDKASPKPLVDVGRIVTVTVTDASPNETEVRLIDGRTGVISGDDLKGAEESPVAGSELRVALLARPDPRGRVVVSRLWAKKKEAWDALEAAVEGHTPIKATVKKVVKGGLGVDLGVRGFVPPPLASDNPSENLEHLVGTEVEALVVTAERSTGKVILNRRDLIRRQRRATEKELLSRIEVGQEVVGKVVSLESFGAFVELGGGRGLLHQSELAWRHVANASDLLSLGDEITVKVIGVDKAKRRISLSLRQLGPDPLAMIELGLVDEGVVTRVLDYGAFVRLDSAEVEGMVHASEIVDLPGCRPSDFLAPGERVRVKVLAISAKRRRVDLSIRQAVYPT